MVWAMFTGLFVIAVAQGLVTGLFFVVAGLPFALMWTVLAVVASMLPLGASMIAVPIGAVQLITGK